MGSEDIDEVDRRWADCFLLLLPCRACSPAAACCRPAEELEGSTISDTVAERCVWCRFDLLPLRLECGCAVVDAAAAADDDEARPVVTTSLAECRSALPPSDDLDGRRSCRST